MTFFELYVNDVFRYQGVKYVKTFLNEGERYDGMLPSGERRTFSSQDEVTVVAGNGAWSYTM